MLSIHYHTLLYSTISLLVAAFPPFGPDSKHKCYFLDGSFDSVGGPCYGNVGASMCCYSGVQNCAPEGLCLDSPNGPVGQYDDGSSIWRRSCTDITWQDPACLAIAYDWSISHLSTESQQLNNCSDGTFCPRAKEVVNTTCCDEHLGEFAALGHARIPVSVVSSIQAMGNSTAFSDSPTTSSNSLIPPATASPTVISKPTASSAPSADSSKSSISAVTVLQATMSTSTMSGSTSAFPSPSASAAGLGESAKIGIGVGISFGTLLVALLSFIAFRLYRNSQSSTPQLGRAQENAPEPKNPEENNVNAGLQLTHELTGAPSPREMYTPYNTHEVEATSRT